MKFCLNRNVTGPFDDVISRVVEALKAEGFGILTVIECVKQ